MSKTEERHRRFAEEYIIDFNASAAYQRAGYRATGNAAESAAVRLLRNVKVQRFIQEQVAARSVRTQVTQDRVLEELAVIDFSNVQHFQIDACGNVVLAPGVPETAMRAVSSLKRKVRHIGSGDHQEIVYETELRLWDKVGALRLTAQHLGMLTEQVAVKTQTESVIHVEHTYDDSFINSVCVLLAEFGGLTAPAAATNGYSPPSQ